MPYFEQVARYAGAFFISGIWQGFVLAGAIGLCLRLVPKTTAALRFAIWAVVLLVIAFLPFITKMQAGHVIARGPASTLSLDVRWSFAIAAVWLAASFFRAADLAVHGLRLWSLRKRSTPIEAGTECDAVLADCSRRVTLCTSTEVDRPSVIGFFSPRILIPTWLFEELTGPELKQIVLHEMEHLRRGDDWLNLLQKISLILFPLNPIVIWVERRLCFERELACDDGVLSKTGAPRAYASCLTNLAERGLDRRAGLLLLGALGAFGTAARQSELARRVHRILRRREMALSPMWSRAFASVVALALLGGAVGLSRCPQIVSFVAPVQALPIVAAQRVPTSVVPDRRDLPAKAEQVVFKESSAPHMTLLTATSSTTPANRHATHKVRRVPIQHAADKTPAVRRVLTTTRTQRDPAKGWIVLSSWTQEVRPQMIIPIVNYNVDGSTTLLPYAAVPTAGGWFIIQL